MATPAKTQSFNENYAKLKSIANTLRSAREEAPDIDGLIPLVKEATAAHGVCVQRIEQVNSMLQEVLQEPARPASAS